MGEILFLGHRIPFPPDRGDKIRSHHILRRLAEIAPVHVATFAEDDYDTAEEPALAALAKSYCLVRRTKPLPLAGIEALASRAPVSLTAFHDAGLERYVRETLARRPISAIYVFSGQMGQYVPRDFAGRLVVDFVDVDSAKFEAYAGEKGGVRGWIDSREGRVLRREEARLAQRADVSLLVSDAEAALFAERLPAKVRASADVRCLANGIDSGTFDPARVVPEAKARECGAPRIVFTGQMDYAPNIAAATRAIREILPRIRESLSEATFHVVGRNPPASLSALHGQKGAYVWGRVPDIRSWLKAADIALVPLEIGRGVQNKVLEAMAMELPVVATPQAATGIAAKNGRDLIVAPGDAELAYSVVGLANDPARARKIGKSARRFVVDHVSWQAALAPLADLVDGSCGTARDAA